MQKRVALVLPNLTMGGAERQAVELALRLPDFGWEPIILAAELHGPLISRLDEKKIPIHDLDARFWLRKPDPRFWQNLAGVINRTRRILVQEQVRIAQSFLFWQSAFAVPAAKLAGTKGIITGRRNLGVYKDSRSHYQWIENTCNRFTDKVICNSRMVAKDALRRERLRREQVRVIRNGIDIEWFSSSSADAVYTKHPILKDAPLVLGTVGNMKRQKRHDLFLRIVAEVRRSIPGTVGLLVGRDLGEEKNLKRLAAELGIDKAVLFTGGVDDPAPYYKAMNTFLLTSDWEGLPNVVLEAMAAGVPVIARPAGGTREIIRDKKNGFLLDSEEPAIYQEVVERLYEDSILKESIVKRALETMENHFSMKSMVENHVRLYEESLDR